MRQILYMIRKEFLQLKRDKKMLAILFVAPMFQLLVLGYAANMDVRKIPMVVCDLDKSSYSRSLLDRFFNTEYFELNSYVNSADEIDRKIGKGDATLGLIIPYGFGDKLEGREKVAVQMLIDGTESNSATVGLNYSQMIINEFGASAGLSPPLQPETRLWYNPDLKSRNFMVPGILAMILMVVTLILTSLAIVKEKEIGTLEQLNVTPLKPFQLIAGKLSPFIIIGMIDVVIAVSLTVFWFGVPLAGSFLYLLVLCAVFLFSTLGMGLFVSVYSSTQQQAMMSSIFFIMVPMMILSGFIFPIENMPEIIQFVTYFMPLRYFFVIIRGLFLKGAGIAELWDESLMLFILGLSILFLSVKSFHKKVQ